MIDETPSHDKSPKDKPKLQGISGGGGGRRATRAGSGDGEDDDDFFLFKCIMQAIKRIEKQTGEVATIGKLAEESGLSVFKIKEILLKYLADITNEANTAYLQSHKSSLLRLCGMTLTENGLISPEQWQQIQIERERTGEAVSLILSRLGLASENQMRNVLELQYGVNYLPLKKVEQPSPECLALLPEALMRQHQLVPVMKDGNRITLAMVNPNNLVALDDIKTRLKGMQIKLAVCTEDDFHSFMETIYSQHLNGQ